MPPHLCSSAWRDAGGVRCVGGCLVGLIAGLAPPAAFGQATVPASAPATVQVQMRNVAFHVDSTVVLDIRHLRGTLRRTKADRSPYLDDKTSFDLAIDTASVGISPQSLGDLLNHHTFAYPGSPLRGLRIAIVHGQLEQQGRMHGISFTILGDLSLTPDGELRLHPSSIKAVGIKVGGLMKLFGLHLQKLVDTRQARGVRVERDDFVLSPSELLPPPKVDGRLVAETVNDSEIVLVFHRDSGKAARDLPLPRPATNYMFFREGVLRFGKLTMHDTDLLIVDAHPADPFDFFLDHYNEQLVAGYSRNTTDHGLLVTMPDYRTVASGTDARRH